jgi:hypothetical protein
VFDQERKQFLEQLGCRGLSLENFHSDNYEVFS